MKVVLSGFGMMGRTLLDLISVTEDIDLIGVVDPLGQFGVKTFQELPNTPDVIIDFSHPNLINELLDYSTKNNVNVLIATTGLTDDLNQSIETASSDIAILKTGNTSLGVNVLLEVVKQITPLLSDSFDIEIIEKHHNKKIDAPSGTAKMFVDEIVEARKQDSTILYGREGQSKREQEDITVHAVRGGTIPGEHSIIFAGNDEVIEIKHQALSKKVFATGALKAVRFLNTQSNGLFDMKDILL